MDLHSPFPTRKVAVGDREVTVVDVNSVLTTDTRLKLKWQMQELIESTPQLQCVIDLSGTGYVDKTGLSLLQSVSKHMLVSEGTLVLAGLNEDLIALFHIVKLDSVFFMYPSVDEALRHFDIPALVHA